jgi:hypothetical protein
MRDFKRWSKVLSICGGIGLLVGSVDPMEGAVLILPGSALLALGSYLGRAEERATFYRTWSFLLIAVGVGALFGLSAIGGVGGTSGRSAWWALLILPYGIGWSMDLWGPGVPRWLSMAGIAIGAWYLGILAMMLRGGTPAHARAIAPAIALAIVGVGTIVACTVRLRRAG